jgi:hypothetical protein
MKTSLLPPLLSIAIFMTGGTRAVRSEAGGQAAFRVRSDFAAGLNSDQGWAGALNENVTVSADQPFRIRFEMEGNATATGTRQFQLQYRRNEGEWTAVEAHDFPHPERDLTLRFARAEVGGAPQGWSVAQGSSDGLTIAAEGRQNVLRAQAGQEALIGVYTPPWQATEMATQFRLPAGSRAGIGFVFGYVDAGNHGRVALDPVAGSIRLSRFANGMETVITEKKAGIPPGDWLEIEIQIENGEVEVNYQDETLEFTAPYGAEIPTARFGFVVPAGSRADFRTFAIAGEASTPRVSIVACPAYENGAATSDLLKGSVAGFHAGAGINLAEQTPAWGGTNAHGEFEWALVVRRFADGAVTNEEGDIFGLRMVDASGTALGNSRNPMLRFAIPPGHVGGTFVENPGRIGPWRASNGDLYFMMEPAETENVFMMIKSTDNGRTWREVDAGSRPRTDDLESVDSRQVGDTIHILHQVTRSTRYHSFRTSDHPTHPDTWAVRDQVAGSVTAIAQTATMVVRSDESMVAFYLGQARNHYSVRSPAGAWSEVKTLDADLPPNQAGPQAVLGASDTVHLAYYGTDGSIWYRRFLPDGTLTPRQQLATGAGTSRAEYGAVLPLLYNSRRNEVIIIYRLANGNLWERRVVNDSSPTPAARVTDRNVVTDAVDSQQPGADAVLDGETVHVLFIEQSSRSIFSTHDQGGWQAPNLQVDNILGSWVRGNVYTRKDGVKVYGYVYDAGSDGGAGMNRFDEIVLSGQ